MYRYDDVFFSYIEAGARRSADVMVPVLAALGIRSVVDVGCGRGAWLQAWAGIGVEDTVGIDGPYVSADTLLISTERFRALDLTRTIELGRTFDLATSFEVGEHLPTPASATLVETLCRHAPLVAFSAAVPGQGGEHHVNEQPLGFWRGLFAEQGFVAHDAIRPLIAGNGSVEPWYRFNSILYVREDACGALPPAARATRIAPDVPIPDLSPLPFRLRKAVLRHLPVGGVDRLAVAKHRLVLARLRLGAALPRAFGLGT